MDKVAENCARRKGLEEVETLDNLNLRHWRGLDPAEAGSVRGLTPHLCTRTPATETDKGCRLRRSTFYAVIPGLAMYSDMS